MELSAGSIVVRYDVVQETPFSADDQLAIYQEVTQAIDSGQLALIVDGNPVSVTIPPRLYAVDENGTIIQLTIENACDLYNVLATCQNGGRCVELDGVPSCSCGSWFRGTHCEEQGSRTLSLAIAFGFLTMLIMLMVLVLVHRNTKYGLCCCCCWCRYLSRHVRGQYVVDESRQSTYFPRVPSSHTDRRVTKDSTYPAYNYGQQWNHFSHFNPHQQFAQPSCSRDDLSDPYQYSRRYLPAQLDADLDDFSWRSDSLDGGLSDRSHEGDYARIDELNDYSYWTY